MKSSPTTKRVDCAVQAESGEVRQEAVDSALPEALKHFDSLPNAANVRQPVVQALFGISGPTVWRWVKAGRLPKPRKQSERVTTWNVGELRSLLTAGVASGD